MTGAPGIGRRRAFDYPYVRPDASFVLDPRTGVTRSATTHDVAGALGDPDRDAVLAIGSNAAPSQLCLKFAGRLTVGSPIVVARATWIDHDAVFAARIASYGAVPATFTASPGTSLGAFVTFVDRAQLARLDETEGVSRVDPAYVRVEVRNHEVHIDGAGRLGTVWAYEANPGPLLVDGHPIALAALTATHRRFDAWNEFDVLALLARRSDLSVDDFVDRLQADRTFRARMHATLAAGVTTR